MKLGDHFDKTTLQRGVDYARCGYVEALETLPDGSLRGRVRNDQGKVYRVAVTFGAPGLQGVCTCPVGTNCKHAVALLMVWGQSPASGPETMSPAEQNEQSPTTGPTPAPALPREVSAWIDHMARVAPARVPVVADTDDTYPPNVKDRLLFVVSAVPVTLQIDTVKGRVGSGSDSLQASMRPYNALSALRAPSPPKFLRHLDRKLLTALAKTSLWRADYAYTVPELLKPGLEDMLGLLRRLCDTGRFLFEPRPDAQLRWSTDDPDLRLAWHRDARGCQRLRFEDAQGRPLLLKALDDATVWVDPGDGTIGHLSRSVTLGILYAVKDSPVVMPEHAPAVAAALPVTLGDLALPRPGSSRRIRRDAAARHARLVLGEEQAREGLSYWSGHVRLPTLTLSFVYDGHEVRHADEGEPAFVEGDTIVTLSRDLGWEGSCADTVLLCGAVPVEDLEMHVPSDRMAKTDFVFADGELSLHLLEPSSTRDAMDFAFRVVTELRQDGWEIVETSRWPYRLSTEPATLSVTTRTETGDGFQGHDWFSLGFSAEIGGKTVDVAPLIAAFLEQMGDAWDDIPDIDTLTRDLAARPIYLDRGKKGYVALDLSPLARLLHLFLTHHAELGALHPTEANVARLAEEALAGSSVRFSDSAGILPLAQSLNRLSAIEAMSPPAGLTATLRGYQAYGAAWMGTLIEAGFGGVLADDMGLGKTIQTLALLQARRERGAAGPALLIVPTSLLHGWQSQAAQFTPDLRLVVLHGPGRHALREQLDGADLVITTYPLLVRDRDWLAARPWPLVILDEAQTLKNPASQMAKVLREVPAQGRLALTGTPLENSLQDLWTLMDWLVPGLLGNRKQFVSLFRTPIEKHGDTAAQARLNRRVRPFLLRRTKEEVAAELPPRTEILDRVDLPKPQQALYETVRSAMDVRVREAIATRGLAASRITVLDALLKLRQVCCDPSLVKTEAARSVTDSAKRTRLRELVTELVAEGRRVLVFSQFVTMLQLIAQDLAEAGIASLSLTGQTQDRAGVLDAFAKGHAPVFLLSLKAGGVGLTLTEADTVILYDPWWNPAVERQAMDRAHRIGQTKPVFVHRLVAAGTVEEKILDMQARKQALADALFDAQAGETDLLLDEATLQDLFAPLRA